MLKLIRASRLFAAVALLLLMLSTSMPAHAQLDYDTYDIYQNGAWVGVIYVPLRGADPSVYEEYWIMTNHYQYPSQENPVPTEIVHSRAYHFDSLADFLEHAPWGDGYRYVTVVAFDRGTKPMPANTTGIAGL